MWNFLPSDLSPTSPFCFLLLLLSLCFWTFTSAKILLLPLFFVTQHQILFKSRSISLGMQFVQKSHTLACIDILNTIEALRNIFANPMTSDAGRHHMAHPHSFVGLNHMTEVSTKVLAVLRDMHSLSEEKILFFEVYEKDITSSLVLMRDMLEKCLHQVPNHFGVYEVHVVYIAYNVVILFCINIKDSPIFIILTHFDVTYY